MFNLSAYYTYIKTHMNCWCCTSGNQNVEAPTTEHHEHTRHVSITIDFNEHEAHTKLRPGTPKPVADKHLTLG